MALPPYFCQHRLRFLADPDILIILSPSLSRTCTLISGAVESPKIHVFVDMEHPFLNRTVDGFLKIGSVAASRAVAQEAYDSLRGGSVSKQSAENALKKMCKEGLYWGTIAGVYTGMEYGMERIRGNRDWKNALLGGAITGAVASAASNNRKDKVMVDAITGGAVATAAEFLNYLT